MPDWKDQTKLQKTISILISVGVICWVVKACSNQPDFPAPPTSSATAAESPPIESPKPIDRQFTDTLTDATEGFNAQATMHDFAPYLYLYRKELWNSMKGETIDQSYASTYEALKTIAVKRQVDWANNNQLIQNMSNGIVKGLHAWNKEHPEDL
jgi:hypothetical protein